MKFKRVICMGMAVALACSNLPQVTVCAQQIQEETGKDRGEDQGQEDNPLCLQNLGVETEDVEEANPNQAMSEEGRWHGNFQYKELEDGTLAITDYKEDGVKEVTVPGEIEGKKVVRIETSAFWGCSSLSSVSIPAGVTTIDSPAFSKCSSLKEIVVDEKNQKYFSQNGILYGLFNDTNAGVICCPAGKTGKVDVSERATLINFAAFSGCSSLSSVSIPKAVTYIGDEAFKNCSSLKTISIPKAVTYIGNEAFLGCSSLSVISIPEGVTFIADSAFGGCSSLKEIVVDQKNQTYASKNGIVYKDKTTLFCCPAGKTGKIAVSKGVTSINSYAFRGCSGLTSVIIPGSVMSIGYCTFYDCSGLTSVTIPGSVTSIAQYAFGYSDGANGVKKMPNFIIYGTSGSEAERYAKDNGFTFRSSGGDSSQGDKITCKKTVYKVAYGAKPFKINASSKSKMAFTSSKPKVAAVGKNTGKVTIKNTGVATVTIKAGKASKKVAIKVSPKKPSVKSAKAVKGRKLAVNWAKDKRASGYQVQVSTDKKFKKGVKSKKLSKTSYTFTKLKTGKTYYVRVRSYKKSGKETLYSAWSKGKQGGKIKK